MRRRTLIDPTYDQFADDSYDLSRIKNAATLLIDRVLASFIDVETEEAAYRLRDLIDANSRRHVRETVVACDGPDADDCEF